MYVILKFFHPHYTMDPIDEWTDPMDGPILMWRTVSPDVAKRLLDKYFVLPIPVVHGKLWAVTYRTVVLEVWFDGEHWHVAAKSEDLLNEPWLLEEIPPLSKNLDSPRKPSGPASHGLVPGVRAPLAQYPPAGGAPPDGRTGLKEGDTHADRSS